MDPTVRLDPLGTRRVRIPQPVLWRVLAAFALVVALLLGGPALSDAEEDVGVLAGLLQDALSDAGRDVRIRGFEGALSSRATIEEMTIADDLGVWISLTDVVIDWNRAALLDRRVEVNELSAETIELLRLPSTSAASTLPSATANEGFSLPELPVAVHVGDLSADLVRIDASVMGQAAEVSLRGAVNLSDGQGDASFEALRVDLQEGSFVFSGDFDNDTRFLSINLALSEGQGGIAATLLGIPDLPALGLSVGGDGPITTFSADMALSTDGAPRVSGRFSLVDETPETGVLQGGGFSLDIAGDLRPLLSAELHPFFGESSLLRATGQRSENGEVSLPDLTVTTGAMNLSGAASFAATGLPQLVRLTAEVENPNGDPVLLPGTSGAGRLRTATLLIEHDASLSRDWRVRAEIATLDLPEIEVGSAVLEARGRLNGLNTAVSDTQQPPFEGVFEFLAQNIQAHDPAMQRALGSEVFGLASVVWPGPSEAIELTGLALEGETLSMTAYGALEGLTFDGFAEFSAPDLSAFSGLAGRDLGGEALASMQGRANPVTGALDLDVELVTTELSLDLPEADGLLAGRSRISGSLRRDLEGTEFRDFALNAGAVQASLQGQIRPGAIDLTARLATEDLSPMGDGYGGHIALDVQLVTEDDGQRLRFDGSAIDLRLADLPASDLLGGLLNGANRLRGDLTLRADATDVTLLSVEGPHIALTGEGVWSASAPDLALSLGRLDLAGLHAGGDGVLEGEVRLIGAGNGARRIVLALNGGNGIRSGIPQIDSLLIDGLSVTSDATIAADGGLYIESAVLQAAGFNVTAQGTQDPDGNTTIALQGRLDNVGQLAPGMSGPLQLNATIAQQAGQSGYGVDADLAGPLGFTLNAGGRVNPDFTLDLALSGRVESVLMNPSIEPANVRGLVQFNGTVQGPASINSLRLNARTSGARYVLPGAGVALQNIEGEAQLNGLMSRVQVSGDSLAGGRGFLDGTIDLAGARQANLTVRVEEYLVQQPQLFDARINGSVSLTGSLRDGAQVRGEVAVSQGEIRIPSSPLGRQAVGLNGLRHVSEGTGSRQTRAAAGIASGARNGRVPASLHLDLTLTAAGQVFVRGRGLDAELGGSLHLGGTTHDVIPSGSFGLIRGRLDLLGNRFTLTDGSASMVGDFTPFVTLVATTESDGISTSVTLSGRANSPEIAFSSIPELPQDEVLARLIFRRSLATLSPFQAAQLALSVATLTGRAESSILSRTRHAMGLDDLDFTVDDNGNTALRAGRYLTDRVYTDVTVDSTGRGEVSINLGLTPGVTLRGRTDTEGRSGVGIYFERDY